MCSKVTVAQNLLQTHRSVHALTWWSRQMFLFLIPSVVHIARTADIFCLGFLRQHSRTNLFTTILLNHNVSVQLNFIRCKHFVCLPDLMLVSWTETLWFRKKGQQQYFTGSVSVLCVRNFVFHRVCVCLCVCVRNFVFVCTHYSWFVIHTLKVLLSAFSADSYLFLAIVFNHAFI